MEEPFGDEIAGGRLVKPPGLLEETESLGILKNQDSWVKIPYQEYLI